jgi:hypothetical protein
LKTTLGRRFAAGVAALAAAIITLVATPNAALASDVNPYSASAVCGSGFSVIDKAVKEGVFYIYLLWNPSTGENCVVNLKQFQLGTKTPMHAFIQTAFDAKGNTGDFGYYAGPVKMKAAGDCIMWGGSATVSNGTIWSYFSDYEHCGS